MRTLHAVELEFGCCDPALPGTLTRRSSPPLPASRCARISSCSSRCLILFCFRHSGGFGLGTQYSIALCRSSRCVPRAWSWRHAARKAGTTRSTCFESFKVSVCASAVPMSAYVHARAQTSSLTSTIKYDTLKTTVSVTHCSRAWLPEEILDSPALRDLLAYRTGGLMPRSTAARMSLRR